MRFKLLAATLFAVSLSAHADTVSFALNGTFATGTLTGTLVIDTTAGTIISGNAKANEGATTYMFNSSSGSFSQGPVLNFYKADFVYPNEDLDVFIPLTSLVGYQGGAICSELNTTTCDGQATALYNPMTNSVDVALTGSLTPIAPTPEPSSLALLATGILSSAAFVRRHIA